MNYQLHPPTPQHYTTLASWIPDAAQCLRWAGPKLGFPFDAQQLPALLATEACDTYALVDADQELAGFGQIFRREPGVGHLGRIIVDPQRRKQGLGQVLCKALVDAGVRQHGFRAMTLWVFLDNPPAVQLYTALGFVPETRENGMEGCQFMRLNVAL